MFLWKGTRETRRECGKTTEPHAYDAELLLGVEEDDEDYDEQEDPPRDAELESIIESICDESGLVSKAELRNWEDGLVGI